MADSEGNPLLPETPVPTLVLNVPYIVGEMADNLSPSSEFPELNGRR